MEVNKSDIVSGFLGLCFCLFLAEYSRAQSGSLFDRDSINKKIVDQFILNPKQKLYAHLDKLVYVAGEKIWFRLWVTDAVLHRQVAEPLVFVELINPVDSVVYKTMVKQNQGSLSGMIPLNIHLPEGDYTFCVYTRNFKDTGKETLYKKQISILSPLSAKLNSEVRFTFHTEDELTAEVSFTDLFLLKKIVPESAKVKINEQPSRLLKSSNDTAFRFSFNLSHTNLHRILLLEYKNYSRFFNIPLPESDYDVTFYPEGGYLIEGEECKVAYKALCPGGIPASVSGKIVDNNNQEVTVFNVRHDGMGQFLLTPKEGHFYYAVCRNEKGKEKRFVLPVAEKEACSLKVQISHDKLDISVQHSGTGNDSTSLWLLLHTRGMVHYISRWDWNYGTLSFQTDKFPSGVLQAILLDSRANPVSERLIFCINNDQAHAECLTDRDAYHPRQLVNARVKMAGSNGLPLEGAFSVSVTDDKDVRPDSTSSILTGLLLTSEVKGYIRNPAYYFQEDNKEAREDLDLLMLTNGWRRYNIPGIIRGEPEKSELKEYLGMPVSGEVRSVVFNKPVKKGKVSILSWQADYYNETETDSAGRYCFYGIEYPDSTVFVVQALNKNNSGRVELLPDHEYYPFIPAIYGITSVETADERKYEKTIGYVSKAEAKYSLDTGIPGIMLEEVVVTAPAPPPKEYSYSYYMPAGGLQVLTDDKIDFSQYNNVSEILIHIPFVRTEGGLVIIDRMNYNLNGVLPAVLIIDDLILTDYDINMINPSDIERIGVLKGAQASILGGLGTGGALVITTKKGMSAKDNSPVYNIRKISPPGYQKPVEFYAPRYETVAERDNGDPDLRTTIYWNPNVIITPDGNASFDFYTADAATTYSVVIEGIASDGSIICGHRKISRK
jgi:hypothetical protein